VISCSIATMDIATKGWSSAFNTAGRNPADSPLVWVSLLVQAHFFIVSKCGMIYGCGHCDMLVFIPVNIVLNVFFTAAAGLFVLGEACQVPGWKAWLGLASAMMCVVGGIVMLVSGPAQAELPASPLGQEQPAQPLAGETSGSDGETPSSAEGSAASAPARLNSPLFLLVTKSAALACLNGEHRLAAHSRELLLEEVMSPVPSIWNSAMGAPFESIGNCIGGLLAPLGFRLATKWALRLFSASRAQRAWDMAFDNRTGLARMLEGVPSAL